jgi:very-short-patch-repair endonuclease
MTRLSLAELRQRCIDNPDFAAANAHELRKFSKPVVSHAVRELNPDTAPALTRRYDAADTLLDYIRTLAPDMPKPVRDHPFERFRIDLAWPDKMLAVEVDGGQFKPGGGKHGSKRDYEKINALTMASWRVIRFRAIDMRADPIGTIDKIMEALCTS